MSLVREPDYTTPKLGIYPPNNAVGEVEFGLSLPNLCKKQISYKKVAAYGGSRSSQNPPSVKYSIKLFLSFGQNLIQYKFQDRKYFEAKVRSFSTPLTSLNCHNPLSNVSFCPTFPIRLAHQRLTDDTAQGSVA